MPKIDLTNKQFDYYRVIGKNIDKSKNSKNTWWNCQCKCGKIFTATTTNINKQRAKSCGCMKSQLLSQAHLQDLTGKTFGELYVLRRNKEKQIARNRTNTMYDCLCSCGNIITVERGKLISRGQSSCGCKNSIGELHINILLSQNKINYVSQYTNSDLISPNNGYLRFDFAILNDSNEVIRLIEFDGPQHNTNINYFKNNQIDLTLQARDNLKNNYAKEHQIPLIRIPYYKRDCLKLEDLLGNQFLI